MDKDLIKMAVKTKQYKSKKRKRIIIVIVWPVIAFIFGFFGLPVIWFIMMLTWPIVIIFCIISLISKRKIIALQMQAGTFVDGISHSNYQAKPTVKNRHDNESKETISNSLKEEQRGVIDNPVVKAASIYALGKAAMTAADKIGFQTIPEKNPNTERYMKAQREANRHLSSTRKNGREKVRFKNGDNGYIETESNGAQYLVDYGNRRRGSYDPIRNETYDKNGKKVGSGNLLKELL